METEVETKPEMSDPNSWPRQDETNKYLQEHRVLELFNNLTASLIFIRPADPKKYMIETLEKLQKAKKSKRDAPCLFDDSNIQSVYGMLDPTNRGYITLKQYSEALLTLGIKDFTIGPDGAADDRITFETFLNEAEKARITESLGHIYTRMNI